MGLAKRKKGYSKIQSLWTVLHALEARTSLMIREGEMGAIGTMDEEAWGYYLVRWLCEPYVLQEDMDGMSGIISAGVMVAGTISVHAIDDKDSG